MIKDELGLLFYVDGRTKNDGNAKTGYGAHGYLFSNVVPKQGTGLNAIKLTNVGYVRIADMNMYTDLPQSVTPIEYYDIFGTKMKKNNNVAGELECIISVLPLLVVKEAKSILFLSQRKEIREGIRDNRHSWKKNNWKDRRGNEIQNAELWKEVDKLIEDLEASGHVINVAHSLGHNKIGITEALSYARLGAIYNSKLPSDYTPLHNLKETPAKGYWSKKHERHPFLAHKKIIFNNTPERLTKGRYYMTDPSNEALTIGMKLPNAAYSIVMLDKPEKAIEDIRLAQCEFNNGGESIVLASLDKIFSREMYDVFIAHGDNCLIRPKKNNVSLTYLDDETVTEEITPPGHAFRAVTNFSVLGTILDEYIRVKENNTDSLTENTGIRTLDITDVFFEKQIIKKAKKDVEVTVLKKSVDQTEGRIDITLTTENFTRVIPLVLGLDILPRNSLKKLEDLTPKIDLVYWADAVNKIRFATVITVGKSIGIWASFYSNALYTTNHENIC